MTLVTGAVYRSPGLLAKIVTTLDVLSGGRAWLGIGAAWNEEEARGLGLSFPPTAERFERLEETLQICLQMWSDDDGPYHGKHYQLERTLNSPQAMTKPHPPILIGGSGEKKTLRLVARYAQACNLFPGPEIPHKLDVLRQHCEAEGTRLRRDREDGGVPFRRGRPRREGRRDHRSAAVAGRHGNTSWPTAGSPTPPTTADRDHRQGGHSRHRRPLMASVSSNPPCAVGYCYLRPAWDLLGPYRHRQPAAAHGAPIPPFPPMTETRSSSARREWPATNWSTWGSAAAIPWARGCSRGPPSAG